MIRELSLEDINEANLLLSDFGYKLTAESFDNAFFKSVVYFDNGIKGIIVYDFIYDRIEIEYIIVSPDYRKKGVGTLLLKSIENNNVKNITLEVKESNVVAINFYKKNGYKIEAMRKNYYGNKDGYLMLKELGE